jgi:hypothetical protein
MAGSDAKKRVSVLAEAMRVTRRVAMLAEAMRAAGVVEAELDGLRLVLGPAVARGESALPSPVPYCACGHAEHEHDPECLLGCTSCTARTDRS